MGDSSQSYIRLVQHLIEKCLIFKMTKEECMEALSKHANIKPVITSTAIASHTKNLSIRIEFCFRWGLFFPSHILTYRPNEKSTSDLIEPVSYTISEPGNPIWNELEKENKEFFEAYAQSQSKQDRMSEEETSQMIQKMISDSPKDPDE
ncbi:Conserved hypothetical protein CHP01589 [Theobroma cacao]|nr:Conserved hypothetical protein CHP01589 [Theobroma cacao]